MSIFSFDSRDNHQKLNGEPITTSVSVPSFTFQQQDTLVTHNLGYKPNMRVYCDYSGDVWPVSENFWTGKDDLRSHVYSTNSAIVMQSDNIDVSTVAPTVYVRVYEDGSQNQTTNFTTFKRTERVLKRLTGSFSASGSGAYTTETIAHGLSDAVLPVMRWNDGTGWRDMDKVNYDASYSNYINAIPYVNSTNVKIEAINSYSTTKTIEYEILLYKRDFDDGFLFDSREKTFNNFEEGTATQELTGSWTSGQVKTYTLDVAHNKAASFGEIYWSRSDEPTKEYKLPVSPLVAGLPSSGSSDFGCYMNFEYQSNNLQIYIRVNNPNAGTETIDDVTLSFRYATFVASQE